MHVIEKSLNPPISWVLRERESGTVIPQKLRSPAKDGFDPLDEENGNGTGTGTLTPT
jgi:hypothetical protein